LKLLDVHVEPVEALVPEALEAADPFVDRAQPAGVETVEALFADLAVAHEPDFSQHPEVFRRSRLRHPEFLCQSGHRLLTASQQDQDLTPLRLGDRVEDVRRRGGSGHAAIICRYRNASRPEIRRALPGADRRSRVRACIGS
jgi:hypothetical protein